MFLKNSLRKNISMTLTTIHSIFSFGFAEQYYFLYLLLHTIKSALNVHCMSYKINFEAVTCLHANQQEPKPRFKYCCLLFFFNFNLVVKILSLIYIFHFQNGDSSSVTTPKESISIRRLSEKFASVSFKSGRDCVENDAFEGIGDDDL